MANSSLCGLLALLCAVSLLSSIGASTKELSAADAVVEARNDETVPELPQPQADKDLADSLSEKSDLVEKPIVPAEDDDKASEPKEEKAPLNQDIAAAQTETSEKDDLVLAINDEVLKQPGMARLARQLNSFHNYQVFRTKKSALLQRAANNNAEYDDGEDDGIVPEERAVRRRKRIRRRNTRNKINRKHNNRNIANRLNSARRDNRRRKSEQKVGNVANLHRGNNNSKLRGGSNQNKKSTKKRTNYEKKRRSSKKGSRKSKRKSSQRKRTKKNSNRRRKYVNDEEYERSNNMQAEVAQGA